MRIILHKTFLCHKIVTVPSPNTKIQYPMVTYIPTEYAMDMKTQVTWYTTLGLGSTAFNYKTGNPVMFKEYWGFRS